MAITTASDALAAKAPALELVQSAPAETELADPKLRFAKDVWVELADQAQKTLDLAQFYTSASKRGPELEPVIAALERAGKRGVKIRLMVSSDLLKPYRATFDRLRAIPNLEARVLNIEKLTGGILHAKYWIVDGERVFVGSQNFDWRALGHIHEMGVLARSGELAQKLGSIFEIDWTLAGAGSAEKVTPAEK
ncbi:MAG: hypothetical protein IT285_07490, partial [Bdellovibrionales bacterium]|nr:hypothetical protein [Bdellovibrionales bacterium]